MPVVLVGAVAGLALSSSPALDAMNDRAGSTLASTASGRFGTAVPMGALVRLPARRGVDLDLAAHYAREGVTAKDRFGQGMKASAELDSAQAALTLAISLLPRAFGGRQSGGGGKGTRPALSLSLLGVGGGAWLRHGNRLVAPLEQTHVDYGYTAWQALGGAGLRVSATLGQRVVVELDGVYQYLAPFRVEARIAAATIDGRDRSKEPGVLGLGAQARAHWHQGIARLNLLYRP